MHSIFEEQIVQEELAARAAVDEPAESQAEALSYFPRPGEYRLGPEQHLEQLRRIKAAVAVPVIASLSGATPGGWLRYAQLLAEAGADALELNLYVLATDPAETGAMLEQRQVELVREIKRLVPLPLAVKLSPFYSSLPHVASRLDAAGADGLVLFNRFYQPDLDIEALNVSRTLEYSTSSELVLRLRWLAILSGRVRGSLAATGGVHTVADAVKAVMAGAHAVQTVSALLQHGPDHLRRLRDGLSAWLEAHEYESLEQMRGSLDLRRSPDPSAFERANYVHILQDWRG
jgi:dihydroorotate dehydrogenase (fumarate)